MSQMLSGLTNTVSGWVKKGGTEEGEAAEHAEQAAAAAEGEAVAEGEAGAQQAAGGVSGLAHGLMSKAMAAKEGIKEKASSFQAPNLHGIGSNFMQGVTNLIPGRKEEEVPTPPEPIPPSDIGADSQEVANTAE